MGWIHAAIIILVLAGSGCSGEEAPDQQQPTTVSEAAEPEEVATDSRRRILFFGDSITAGYGLDEEEAFPAVIQEMIDDRGWPFLAVNGGLSGETTAGGLRRIDWMLRQPVDVFVLELGGNDGLRGIAPGSTQGNLIKIIEKVREDNPDAAVIVAGMRMPPNLGHLYTGRFARIYPEVAEETGSELIPFIGEDVVGHDRYIQMDGIHPTAAGHEVIAQTVWKHLEPVLQARMTTDS